jgi:hypothetical protein
MGAKLVLIRNKHATVPLQPRFMERKQRIVMRHPIALIVLTLAMLFAPLSVCVAHARVETHHEAGMHMGSMHGHDGSAKHHICSACQPLFTCVGKTAGDAGKFFASPPAVAPVVVSVPGPGNARPSLGWYGRAPPIPPPLPIASRVRLQI